MILGNDRAPALATVRRRHRVPDPASPELIAVPEARHVLGRLQAFVTRDQATSP
jgi:hypothetical protein